MYKSIIFDSRKLKKGPLRFKISVNGEVFECKIYKKAIVRSPIISQPIKIKLAPGSRLGKNRCPTCGK